MGGILSTVFSGRIRRGPKCVLARFLQLSPMSTVQTGTAMARKILALAHHKRPEQHKGVRRVFPDRHATRCGEPDRRRGPGRRRDDEESMSVRELVSTGKPLSANRRLVSADRRLGPRRVTDVKVFVYDGIQLTKGRLRDISVKGAFIETKNLALAKGTHVEVVLKIRHGGKPTHCRLPAKVVRVERGGAAVMFGDLDEQTYNILLEIVRPFEQKPAARSQIGGCE